MKIYLMADSYGVEPLITDTWDDDIDEAIHEWIEQNGKDNIPFGTYTAEEYFELVRTDGQEIADEQMYPINGGEYYISAPVYVER